MSSSPAILTVNVDSKEVIFTTSSYGGWLDANGYAFLQQKHTRHNEIVYVASFEELVEGESYTSIKVPLHAIKLGIDANTNKLLGEGVSAIRQEVSMINSKVDQFINLFAGTIITIVIILGILSISQMVRQRLHHHSDNTIPSTIEPRSQHSTTKSSTNK